MGGAGSGPSLKGWLFRTSPAETKSHGADLAGAIRTRLQPARRGHEVFLHLGPIHLLEHLAALLVITRITADAGEAVRSKCEISLCAEAARDLLYVPIQPPTLEHH